MIRYCLVWSQNPEKSKEGKFNGSYSYLLHLIVFLQRKSRTTRLSPTSKNGTNDTITGMITELVEHCRIGKYSKIPIGKYWYWLKRESTQLCELWQDASIHVGTCTMTFKQQSKIKLTNNIFLQERLTNGEVWLGLTGKHWKRQKSRK